MLYEYEAEQRLAGKKMANPWVMHQFYPNRPRFERNPLLAWLHAQNLDALVRRKQALLSVDTPDKALAHCVRARARFAETLAPMPPRSGQAPNSRRVGRFSMPGYTVEKLLIESLPGYCLTASLYLPEGLSAPAPGVLFLCGHAANGKAYGNYTAFCAEAARNGLCVLTFDPVGQGERVFLPDSVAAARGCHISPDFVHCHLGLQMHMLGEQLGSYMIHDCQIALDHLASRPEVDAERLAACGQSGGGQATAFLGALDPRLKAIAPSCYITQLYELSRTVGVQEIEQSPHGFLAQGLDIADLIAAAAPTPYMVSGGLFDFFPIEGLRDTCAEAKRVYGLLGKPEALGIFISSKPHGFWLENRRAVMAFLCRSLGMPAPRFPSKGIEVPDEAQLACADGDVRSVNTRSLLAIARESAARRRVCTDAAQDVARCLGICVDDIRPRHRLLAREGAQSRFELETTPGMLVRATLWGEAGPRLSLCLGAADEKTLREGPVLVLEPRGTGAWTPEPGCFFTPAEPCYMNEEGTVNWNLILLGKSMLGLRVLDILAAVHMAGQLGVEHVSLRAEGDLALPALLAALYAPLEELRLGGLPRSFDEVTAGEDHAWIPSNLAFALGRDCVLEEIVETVSKRCPLYRTDGL